MKKFSLEKEAARIRREQEIKEHGKQVWMRKCHVMEDGKSYKRRLEKQRLAQNLYNSSEDN